jgi:hypothetical protein
MASISNRSKGAKGVLLLVGVALGGIAVVCGDAATTSSARAAVARGEAVAAGTVPVEWDAYAVGPREASLELVVERGACGPVKTTVVEGHDSVDIAIDEEQGPGACPAVLAIGPLDVRLEHPLAGRTIEGPSRRRFSAPVSRSRLESAPRLIGFAPQDAAHALALVSQRGGTRIVHRTGGLRRVVAQYPAPGGRLPKSRVVRITIAER